MYFVMYSTICLVERVSLKSFIRPSIFTLSVFVTSSPSCSNAFNLFSIEAMDKQGRAPFGDSFENFFENTLTVSVKRRTCSRAVICESEVCPRFLDVPCGLVEGAAREFHRLQRTC